MTTERQLAYDEKTMILHVKAQSIDDFTAEQVKNIWQDQQSKLAQAKTQLKQSKDLEIAVKKIKSQPRLSEIIETVLLFVQNPRSIPELKAIEDAKNFWQKEIDKLKKEVLILKPTMDKIFQQEAEKNAGKSPKEKQL